jgi:PhoH-like ATPase
MKKIYVLDTNVLLHDATAMFSFQENEIVIPLVVIEELDSQKRRQDEVGRHARLVAQSLDELRARGKLHEGVTLDGGGRLRILPTHDAGRQLPADLNSHNVDNQVLAITLQLKQENPETPVIVVSKDINVRVKADALNLAAEDYETDKIVASAADLYGGMTAVQVSTDIIDQFFRDGSTAPPNGQLSATSLSICGISTGATSPPWGATTPRSSGWSRSVRSRRRSGASHPRIWDSASPSTRCSMSASPW